MFLLDTNVVSEFRKIRSGKADARVVAWSRGVDAGLLFLSVVTVMELEMGVLRIERRDPVQGAYLRGWLHATVLPTFADRILPVNLGVAFQCAPLHVPDPRSDRDALIAATALTHGMRMVTRNVADFAATGVTVLNPWDPI